MKKIFLVFLLALIFVPTLATATVYAQEVIPVEFKIISNRTHQVGEKTYRYPVKLHRADGYTRLRALLDTGSAEFYDVQGVTIQWIFERSPDDGATWYHMVSTTMVSGQGIPPRPLGLSTTIDGLENQDVRIRIIVSGDRVKFGINGILE